MDLLDTILDTGNSIAVLLIESLNHGIDGIKEHQALWRPLCGLQLSGDIHCHRDAGTPGHELYRAGRLEKADQLHEMVRQTMN